jgi:tRNA A-37 threonylcarbamoyl transferase component Bud32
VATKPVGPEAAALVMEFASSLRALHERAGSPTLTRMAQTGFVSPATLSGVQTGKSFPTREATLAYVRGCGVAREDVDYRRWQQRWLAVADRVRYRGSRPAQTRTTPTGPVPGCGYVVTVEGYRAGLREILIWAGSPPRAELIKRARLGQQRLPRATLSDMLRGDRPTQLPSAASVEAFLTACGMPPVQRVRWMDVRTGIETRKARARARKPDDGHGWQLLGSRYRLVERLGAGGMSVVWRGFDEVLKRQVAVKILPPDTNLDSSFRNRLRTEAQAAARLNHPNITNVYDYGESTTVKGETVPYVVMELVDGESLAAVLARVRRLSWPLAIRICTEVSAGLAAAHANGIVHRDVTPANIMLTPNGAQVVDFGLAAFSGANDVEADGTLLGTPAYLAPERLDGGQVSPAIDVYAVGLLIYRSLAGQLPWDVGTTTALLRAQQHTPPAELPDLDGLPPTIRSIVKQCLAKIPGERPSAKELARQLGELSQSPSWRFQPSDWASFSEEEKGNFGWDFYGRWAGAGADADTRGV